MEFKEALEGFLAAAQAKVRAYDEQLNTTYKNNIQATKLETQEGPKYIRVVREGYFNGQRTSSSAYCFIDKATGHVWKPKGWKAAEKKNPRSCIYSEDFGVSGVNHYGTVYLR